MLMLDNLFSTDLSICLALPIFCCPNKLHISLAVQTFFVSVKKINFWSQICSEGNATAIIPTFSIFQLLYKGSYASFTFEKTVHCSLIELSSASLLYAKESLKTLFVVLAEHQAEKQM